MLGYKLWPALVGESTKLRSLGVGVEQQQTQAKSWVTLFFVCCCFFFREHTAKNMQQRTGHATSCRWFFFFVVFLLVVVFKTSKQSW